MRISATEWAEYTNEPSWDLDQSIRLAKLLPALGVDVLDVSSGGNTPSQRITITQTFQTDLAGKIREAVRADGQELLIAAVGLVSDAEFASKVVQEDGEPKADLVLAARQFLREPQFVLNAARDLDVDVKSPNQYHRAPRRKKL